MTYDFIKLRNYRKINRLSGIMAIGSSFFLLEVRSSKSTEPLLLRCLSLSSESQLHFKIISS